MMLIGIVVLTLATAIIHSTLSFPDLVFILNGLAYLTLLAAFFAPIPWLEQHRGLLRWAFISFTALTIVLWILIGERTTIGYVDKLIEVLLIVLLLIAGPHQRASTR
ncbi:MAG TPA: hypothetical protein VFT66_16600 [Roseiflexaceae bacterium]|nr:hypothetical protein [Roseiflexaceae bacterium]